MLNAYPNHPPSAFPLSQSRRALTLAEVLIAMGLMTLGLLGVAAVFPVGGFYMQSGDIADRGGAIAQAALEDAIVRGYLDPKNWVVHDGSIQNNTQGRFISFLYGWRDTPAAALRPGLVEAASRVANALNNPTIAAAQDILVILNEKQPPNAYIPKLLGGAFAIDPIGMSAALADGTLALSVRNPVSTAPMRGFPAAAPDQPTDIWPGWHVNYLQWPVRRVTPIHTAAELNVAGTFATQLPRAQQLFSAGDDLSLTLPDEDDAPAQGLWEVLDGVAGRPAAARQSNRDYSWLLTVAPKSSTSLDAFATKPDAYQVEVSAVVFHKRTVGRGTQNRLESERAVNAAVIQAGPGGGDLLLSSRASDPVTTSPYEDLRVGQFVMVFGPHPLSNSARPMLALRWCRVLSIEKEGRPNINGNLVQLGRDTSVNPPITRALVSLRGPDWPWQPSTNTSSISNNLRVGILPGVVAVHTKTMRLESATEWSIR
jgi:hypothetical protein